MNAKTYQHWQLEIDAEGIAWATFDKAGESTNSLSSAAMNELGQMLDRLDANPPRGLVFRSGKAAGFIAGAGRAGTSIADARAGKRSRTGDTRLESLQPAGGGALPDPGAGARTLPGRRA